MKLPISSFALPSSLLLLSNLPLTPAQWIYPPNVPSDKTLTHYTNGSLSPITTFKIHDALIGSFSTPKPEFSITRCAHAGFNAPIYPLNSTFNSSIGRTAPDGTWEWMDNYMNGMFPNVYNGGSDIWIIPDFEIYVGNDTTGHICWWEMYRVSETTVDLGTWSDVNGTQTYEQDLRRVVTLLGNEDGGYFASTPFVVDTVMREGNRNYTWGSGGGHDNSGTKTTISLGNRPTGNAAPRGVGDGLDTGVLLKGISVVGALLGYNL